MHDQTSPAPQTRAPARRFDPLLLASCLVMGAWTLYMFWRACQFFGADMYTHAHIAADFDFADLHTITSRLAYPLWHLVVAVLYKLGVPLDWAGASVCAACKVAGMLLARCVLRRTAGDAVGRNALTLAAFCLMLVMGVRIPSVNGTVYQNIGSPNVWHNPTQLAVIVTMLLLVPYTMRCRDRYVARRDAGDDRATLSWREVLALAVLSMLSLAAKPTFMQAFLPAAAVLFALDWAREPRRWRFYVRMIVAFLPAALYFLLQYLYYTGVVVPFSSGVAVGLSARSALDALRRTLIMSACPLFCVACCWRKGMLKDKRLVLCLLMVLVSLAEAMLFTETGQREKHGNFFWASMSASLMLWAYMTGVYLRDVSAYLKSERKSPLRGAGYAVALALFAWHLYSGVYYLVSIISRGAVL